MRHINAAGALTSGRTFLTFGGVETHLYFDRQFPMREFCAFEVYDDDDVWRDLEQQFLRPTAQAAAEHGHGLITDALVWRASPDFLAKLGYGAGDLERINRLAVERVRDTVAGWDVDCPVILSADMGPRGDGYVHGAAVSSDDARAYHTPQVRALAAAGVDMIFALTMTNAAEAVGIVRAARAAGLPVVISPTVETDGTLPNGSTLRDFVERVDGETSGYPLFFMSNCAHPTHIAKTLREARSRGETWLDRFRGMRANASRKSHEELDNSTEIDRGDPEDLGRRMAELEREHDLVVLGGCCGTDVEHIRAIASACRKESGPLAASVR